MTALGIPVLFVGFFTAYFTPNQVMLLAIANIVLLVFWSVIVGSVSKAKNYVKGIDGEDRLEQVLSEQFDGSWTLLRNVQLPGGRKDDIDAVLIGPLGVIVFEAKNLGTKNRWDGKTWTRWIAGEWQKIAWHPLKQARQNAERLEAYLAETMEGVPPTVDYRLVWVSGGGAWLEISADRDKVWFISAEGESRRLWLTHGARLAEGEIKTLVSELISSKRAACDRKREVSLYGYHSTK